MRPNSTREPVFSPGASGGRESSRRADLAVVGLAIAYPAAFTLLYFVALAEQPSSVQQTVYALGKTAQFALPAIWILGWRRSRLRPRHPRPRGAWRAGLVTGIIFAAAILVAYHGVAKPSGLLMPAEHALLGKLTGFGVRTWASFLVLGTFYSAVHSWLEEYYWRWFVFGELQRSVGMPVAVGCSSMAFAAHHVVVLAVYFGMWHWATWAFSGAIALSGAVWAGLFHRHGSLRAPWLSHCLADAAIFIVGYDLVGHALR